MGGSLTMKNGKIDKYLFGGAKGQAHGTTDYIQQQINAKAGDWITNGVFNKNNILWIHMF